MMLPVSSATQTAKRCNRWAQECEATSASSWWQRRVVPFIFPSQTHRSRFCRDVEKFEACPKYVQELRLIATPATAGEDATPTPARAFSSISSEHHSGKREPHRCSVFLGTIRIGTAWAWREIRAAAKRVGAVAKCAWSETREKVYSAVLKKTGTERKVGGSSCSVVGGHSPAQPRKAPSNEDRVLAARRALRGSDTTGAVRLAFGLNTVFFVVAGLRFYLRKSRGERLRSREWHRRWRRWQQRGNGGNRRGTMIHGDTDNNSSSGSTVGNSVGMGRGWGDMGGYGGVFGVKFIICLCSDETDIRQGRWDTSSTPVCLLLGVVS